MDPRDVHMLAYGEDVLKSTIAHMTQFDPAWAVPDDFFPASVEKVQMDGVAAKKE